MAENGVTTKQRKAIAALLLSPTIGEAAEAASVGERTITRWLTDDLFVAALRREQDRAIDAAVSRLAGAAATAADTLATIASDENEKSGTRVAASRAILANTLKLIELRDLSQRVSDLERQINERSNKQN